MVFRVLKKCSRQGLHETCICVMLGDSDQHLYTCSPNPHLTSHRLSICFPQLFFHSSTTLLCLPNTESMLHVSILTCCLIMITLFKHVKGGYDILFIFVTNEQQSKRISGVACAHALSVVCKVLMSKQWTKGLVVTWNIKPCNIVSAL